MAKRLWKSVKFLLSRLFASYCNPSFLRKICRAQCYSSYLLFSYLTRYSKSQATDHTLENSVRIYLLQAYNPCHLLLQPFLRSCAHLHDQKVIRSRTKMLLVLGSFKHVPIYHQCTELWPLIWFPRYVFSDKCMELSQVH